MDEDTKIHTTYLQVDRNYKKAYDFAIVQLHSKNIPTIWGDIALNDARFYIDELIENEEFKSAVEFLKLVKDDFRKKPFLCNVIVVENLLEFYEYRIHDRKILQTKYVDKLTREFEKKIFEILGFFATFIAIIFAFINNQDKIKIGGIKLPSFVWLAITIVGSWLVISEIINRKR